MAAAAPGVGRTVAGGPAFTAQQRPPGQTLQQTGPPPANGRGRSIWQTFTTPDGRPYYFNTITRATTYEKPAELKSEAERSLQPCLWAEYKNKEGKAYFHNKRTNVTTWELPPEFRRRRQALEADQAGASTGDVHAIDKGMKTLAEVMAKLKASSAAKPAPAATAAAVAVSQPAAASAAAAPAAAPVGAAPAPAPQGGAEKSKRRRRKEKGPKAPVPDDPREAFLQLLDDSEFPSHAKWGEVRPAICDDERFGLIKKKGQMKQIFAEWKGRRAKQEREEAREERQRGRDAFLASLDASDTVTPDSTYTEAELALGRSEVWQELRERERQDMFREWAAKTGRLMREQRAREEKEMADAFRALLQGHGRISVDSTWSEVKELLRGQPAYDALRKEQRLQLFKDFVLTEESRQEAARRAKQRAVEDRRRGAQAAFKEQLRRLVAAGQLSRRSSWEEVQAAAGDSEAVATLRAAEEEAGGPPGAAADRASEAMQRVLRAVQDDLATEWRQDWRDLEATAFDAARSVAEYEKMGFADFRRRLLHHEGSIQDGPAPPPAAGSAEAAAAAALADDEVDVIPESAYTLRGPVSRVLRRCPLHLRRAWKRVQEMGAEEREHLERRRQRRRERFQDKLMDFFYTREHIDTQWESARRQLRHESAFQKLEESEAKELFEEHMGELRARAAEALKRREQRRAEMAKAEEEARQAREAQSGGERKPASEGGEDSEEEGEVAEAAGQKRPGRPAGEEEEAGEGGDDKAGDDGQGSPSAKRRRE